MAKQLLRAVIVTNPGNESEGPILDAQAYTGTLAFDIFEVDFDRRRIAARGGFVDAMDTVSLAKYGADFGIWFVS